MKSTCTSMCPVKCLSNHSRPVKRVTKSSAVNSASWYLPLPRWPLGRIGLPTLPDPVRLWSSGGAGERGGVSLEEVSAGSELIKVLEAVWDGYEIGLAVGSRSWRCKLADPVTRFKWLPMSLVLSLIDPVLSRDNVPGYMAFNNKSQSYYFKLIHNCQWQWSWSPLAKLI